MAARTRNEAVVHLATKDRRTSVRSIRKGGTEIASRTSTITTTACSSIKARVRSASARGTVNKAIKDRAGATAARADTASAVRALTMSNSKARCAIVTAKGARAIMARAVTAKAVREATAATR